MKWHRGHLPKVTDWELTWFIKAQETVSPSEGSLCFPERSQGGRSLSDTPPQNFGVSCSCGTPTQAEVLDFLLIKRKELIKDSQPPSFIRATMPTQPSSLQGRARLWLLQGGWFQWNQFGVIRKLSSRCLSPFVCLSFSSSYNGVGAPLSNTED